MLKIDFEATDNAYIFAIRLGISSVGRVSRKLLGR